MRVPSHASVSKYHANKNYANLWFILLQVTKGFRFQKNKNVRFISGNFSSERFSWKVKTIRGGLYILINKHLQYQCLEFTILKRPWPILAKTIINSSWKFQLAVYPFDLTHSKNSRSRLSVRPHPFDNLKLAVHPFRVPVSNCLPNRSSPVRLPFCSAFERLAFGTLSRERSQITWSTII